MTAFAEYEDYDGLGLAALVRQGEVSTGEVLEAAIERVEARNPTVNAVVHRLYDEARRANQDGDGPFAGVPFLLKDLYSFYRGAPLGNGSRLFKGYVAAFDDESTLRYRRAGLAILGKTNTSEFGLSVSTEPAAHGPTRNPWDPSRTAGGSSGGAAAAVASGMVPLAQASDGGGSIRIPASCCGLFGLKPSRARNPDGEGWSGLAVRHAVTRSVRDSAALLDATHGTAGLSAVTAAPPVRPFLDEVGADPGRLRIAWAVPEPDGVEVDPACRAAVEDAARLAEELGHHVEPAAPDLDYEQLKRTIITLVEAHMAESFAPGAALLPRTPSPELVQRTTWAMAERGRRHSATDFVRAVLTTQEIGARLSRFFSQYDVLLTPTLAKRPVPLGTVDAESEDLDAFYDEIRAFIPYTQMYNMSGQPAATLPLHWTPEGLPVGVQIGAGAGREATLIRLASQFETARPWFDRRPRLEGHG